MGTGIRSRAAVVAAAALSAVLFVPHTPSAASEGVHIGTYGDRIRVEATSGTTIEIQRPDGSRTHRLAEDVELIHTRAGLVLVNDVSMLTYVEGIAEVPVSWPIEALKAQAVAARTYAWRAIEAGTYTHYDICATVACQVFRGRDVVSVPGGERWAQAVAETDGEALLYEGQPILARYFSTSGGHTRSNEEVFPSSGPRPYLRGVPDPEDVVSPLHTWQVTFSRDEMNAILAEGQRLQAAVPIARVDILPAGGGHPDRVRVVNVSGGSVIMNASTFRGHVARVAPDLFPERFPVHYPGSDRRMPETLPSSRFQITVTDTEVVVDGRGYGHGVGMSQYGAMGKADAGMSYDDILASYYQGIRPTEAPVPADVRVGLEE
jgi:stage II sporulation protein D